MFLVKQIKPNTLDAKKWLIALMSHLYIAWSLRMGSIRGTGGLGVEDDSGEAK